VYFGVQVMDIVFVNEKGVSVMNQSFVLTSLYFHFVADFETGEMEEVKQ
jgi:hypothetical protein